MKLWGQLAKGRSNGGLIASTQEDSVKLDSLCVETTGLTQAQEVGWRTWEFLITPGWCLWKCEALDGDTILIADNFAEDLPDGYPIYSMSELEILFSGDKPVSCNTLRLVHEAKKLAGAKVTTKVTRNEGGN